MFQRRQWNLVNSKQDSTRNQGMQLSSLKISSLLSQDNTICHSRHNKYLISHLGATHHTKVAIGRVCLGFGWMSPASSKSPLSRHDVRGFQLGPPDMSLPGSQQHALPQQQTKIPGMSPLSQERITTTRAATWDITWSWSSFRSWPCIAVCFLCVCLCSILISSLFEW